MTAGWRAKVSEPSTYTESDFEMADKLNKILCVAFFVLFVGAATCETLIGQPFINWIFSLFGE